MSDRPRAIDEARWNADAPNRWGNVSQAEYLATTKTMRGGQRPHTASGRWRMAVGLYIWRLRRRPAALGE